ncbi:MAG: DUF1499 domain-containing protein [Verrucomicrobiales bacterium]|nr:DUF1499 domain-containing protein [Verrucomicrobiales bacterium]
MPSSPNPRRTALALVALAAAAALPVIWWINARTARPAHTAAEPTALPLCPASPNCACSQDPSPDHAIAPLTLPESIPTAQILPHVIEHVSRLPGTRVVRATDRYAHVEFRTRLLRFVDDVEFLLEPGSRTVHVRSASRLGYSDLGTNRRRIESLRQSLAR